LGDKYDQVSVAINGIPDNERGIRLEFEVLEII